MSGINALAARIYAQNVDAGWWDKPREFGTCCMLIVSEVAEAMEGDRKSLQDKHLPHRENAEVELADAMIRIMDLAAHKGYDLEGAIEEKLAVNRTRKDHTREERAKTNGKKY